LAIDSGLEGVLYYPQEVGAVSRSPKRINGPGGEKEIFFQKVRNSFIGQNLLSIINAIINT
jgi:ABC-type taurine transport system ATPase subunit